jgi:hypothetical protein
MVTKVPPKVLVRARREHLFQYFAQLLSPLGFASHERTRQAVLRNVHHQHVGASAMNESWRLSHAERREIARKYYTRIIDARINNSISEMPTEAWLNAERA